MPRAQVPPHDTHRRVLGRLRRRSRRSVRVELGRLEAEVSEVSHERDETLCACVPLTVPPPDVRLGYPPDDHGWTYLRTFCETCAMPIVISVRELGFEFDA